MMRYLALASDYDGTLAHDGVVDDVTIQALEHLVHSGRSLILVTGRELPDLQSVFPRLDLCERVVAENGALIYNPATREKRTLAERPPQSFVDDLAKRGVPGLSAGEVIVATWRPHETQMIEAIRDSGLALQIVFNKEAVMILPSGVNKMTGLCAVLDELKLSPHNVAAIGDAENDHAFLDSCECSVAVSNAIPALKEKADFVTQGARGAGVVELIGHIIENDLADWDQRRHGLDIVLGKASAKAHGKVEDQPVMLPRYGSNVLVCGQSGSGKSTLVTAVVEQIIDRKYQLCLVDPEGDYDGLAGCRTVGEQKQAPTFKQVQDALDDPATPVIVNLLGVSAADRPNSFASLIAEIQGLRIRTGRPHWLVVDEAHHVLPSNWAPSTPELVEQLGNFVLITVHPGHVSPAALSKVNVVVVVGREQKAMLQEFASVINAALPEIPDGDPQPGEALVWLLKENRVIANVKPEPSRSEHQRHKRKYAEGELDPDRSFYFKGPDSSMNLRAQNLNTFVQIAEGIDEQTWLFHLKQHDYSRWLRDYLKDPELADEIEEIENAGLPERESRERVKEKILDKYSAPA